VGFANGGDLLEVMLAVDELKFAPLVDVEWAENSVIDALAGRAEENFRFVEEEIQAGEMLGCGVGEVCT